MEHLARQSLSIRLATRFLRSGFRVQGSGFRVQGSGFRVQGSGFRVRLNHDVECGVKRYPQGRRI
jgi:hypothetical protein